MKMTISIIALIISLIAFYFSYQAYKRVPKISFNKDINNGQIVLPDGSIKYLPDGSFYKPLTDDEMKEELELKR